MAVYQNVNKDSALAEVEFSQVADGNFSFFHIKDAGRKDATREWLIAQGQELVAETKVDGKPVLVMHGEKSQAELMQLLAARGDKLVFHHRHRPFSERAWTIRSALGIGGQCLQLTSSLMRGKRDWGLFTFSVANLTANGINVLFGAQRTEDIHRLRFLKTEINGQLEDQVIPGEALPAASDKRVALHKDTHEQSVLEPVNSFLKRYSVNVGELGLRYLGAFALAFPISSWKEARPKFEAGEFNGAYQTARDPSLLRHYAGLGSITGKTVALFSKAPDPYNPKEHTLLDTIREKLTFHAGGIIEAVSYATLSYDAFTNPNQKIIFHGTQHRDYLSGIGAAMFTAAYVVRNWAEYGVKETNMPELYAHISDSLAKVPPKELPQLMADTAAYVHDQFKDKPVDFGQAFTEIMTDLYRYHHIPLNLAAPAQAAMSNDNDYRARVGTRPEIAAAAGR